MYVLADKIRSIPSWFGNLHRRDRALFPVLAILGAVLFVAQRASGAWQAEFDGYPDEAAQFVSGRILWEYLRTLPRGSPIQWAEQYYLHYPKVAIGHWPPGYQLLEAGWFFLFGATRSSAMWLQWFLGFCALACLFVLIRHVLPAAITAIVLCLAIATPVFQQGFEQTMSEPACLLCSVLFMLAMVRLMRNPVPSSILLVAGSLLAAGLMKGTAIALAPAPLIALAVTRTKLRVRPLWPFVVLGAAAALCLAWYISTIDIRHWGGIATNLPWSIQDLPALAGWGMLGLAALGLRRHPLMILCGSMIASAIAVSFVVRAMNEPRHWIGILPAILILAGSALARFPRPLAALLLVVAALFFPWQWYRQTPEGYRDLIAQLRLPARMLVSTSRGAEGEGGWIAEVSTAEPYPGSFIARASKLLADSDWNGLGYKLLTRTPEQVLQALDRYGLDVVVIDRPAGAGPPHQALLRNAVANSAAWKMCAGTAQTAAYCRVLPPALPREPLVLDVGGRRLVEKIETPSR